MYHANRIRINDNWRFWFENERPEQVTLPHTWNALDTMETDLEHHYRRGVGWYERVPAGFVDRLENGPIDSSGSQSVAQLAALFS